MCVSCMHTATQISIATKITTTTNNSSNYKLKNIHIPYYY